MRHRFLAFTGLAAVFTVVTFVSIEGQTPGARPQTGSAPTTAWGEPDLQGIWTYEYQIPLQRPARYAGKEFFTDDEVAALDKQRAALLRRDRRGERGTEADVAGAYNAVFNNFYRTGRRTSLIVDPPDGRIPPLTPEALKRRAELRAFQLALIQPTEACKNKRPACAGGTYGPPSPRRAEPAPVYSTANVNRADGPEDRSLGERCLLGALPDFGSNFGGSYRRIVQSPGAITIFYDTGQGQGWQRNIVMNGSPHLPSSIRQWWGDSRGHWEGNTLVVDITNFSAKRDYQGSRENLHLIERWTRLDANTIDYAVTIEDPTTWTSRGR